MRYISIEIGDTLKEGDEYCAGFELWHKVAPFMVGDTVAKASTRWRRPVSGSGEDPSKKRLFSIRKSV